MGAKTRARLRGEEGQVIPLLAAGLLVVLLAVAGLVIDLGRAYVVRGKLQAAADASAIAAADALPNIANASVAAAAYGAGPTGANAVEGAIQDPPQPWCLKSVSYCYGNAPGGPATNGQANGVVVREHASVPTLFLNLIGINNINVHVSSTACGMCGTQPLNIVLVVDRTGSMGDDITTLRSALQAFLKGLDPSLDWVSLLVLPPIPDRGSVCDPAPAWSNWPFESGFSYPAGSDDNYVAVHYAHDYLVNGAINPASALGAAVSGTCLKAAGSTAYKQALVAAQYEVSHPPKGREQYQSVIVFESDGAANTAPESFYSGSTNSQSSWGFDLYKPAAGHEDDILRPCGSAAAYSRNSIQPGGTIVYTVGYKVGIGDVCLTAPHASFRWNGKTYPSSLGDLEGSITAPTALAQIASAPDDALSADSSTQLVQKFAGIANKIQSASLVPDTEAG